MSEIWCEDLPYGPLTRAEHDELARDSFYDPEGRAATVAKARGISEDDYLQLRFPGHDQPGTLAGAAEYISSRAKRVGELFSRTLAER
jgi:hypothetical protein